ncbi:O-antigen ligase family protein [Actinokineospora sp. PR83]|uniref:O-antigen ligase family protein n=1 Tax=Actinokineospora sp. PR83 TaxID=2884908 RepID=UPI001F24147C|nr:O-antigen ligase family protein [Actinokineospora sp. PR83]MCG8915576.1 O-antigen ligase family protein [Actinokineospora sp. PR83]
MALYDLADEGRRTRQRADAATLVGVYLCFLVLVPARLVIGGLPLDVRPSLLLGLGLGLCWLCAQMVDNLGMAKGPNPARTGIFVFAASQVATYGYATWKYLPADELKSADLSFITILGLLVVGLLVCDGIRTLDRLDRVLKLVVVTCAIMAFIGLLQFFLGFDLVKYMTVPGLREVGSGESVLERSIFRRPSGTAGHPIEFGVVCGFAVPFAAHYAFRTQAAGLKARNWWICLLLLAMGAVVSLSRSAILGMLVAAIFLIPTWPVRRAVQTVVAATGFLVVLRFFVPGLVGTLLSLFSNISNDPSIQGRTDDYDSTSQTIADNLWLGKGFGTYLPTRYGPLDNQYLGTIVENGLIGLAALIAVFLLGMWAAGAARRATRDPHVRDLAQTILACIAMLGVSSVTYDTFAFKIASGLMFILIGAAGALMRINRATSGGISGPTLRFSAKALAAWAARGVATARDQAREPR